MRKCAAIDTDAPVSNTSSPMPRRPEIEQAQAWLEECKAKHPASICHPRGQGLPTRLVEVTETPMTSKDERTQLSARLVLSAELPPDTTYLTLSHCWGTVPFFTLTEGNLEQMRVSMPVDQLQPLFQDAMSITAQLGFRYIWIDSLCIIQDFAGSRDWLSESGRMDVVYRNSVCNLAATGYSTGRQRLLSDASAISAAVRQIPFPRVSLLELTPVAGDYYMVPSDYWRQEISLAPLHRRAWVIQEQVLARRILHFTQKGLFWECTARVYSQSMPCKSILQNLIDRPIKRMVQISSIKPEQKVGQ